MRRAMTVGSTALVTVMCGATAAAAQQPAAVVPTVDPPGFGTSAARTLGWGAPGAVEDFSGPLGRDWYLYDGPGHAGNGRRTPAAVAVRDGILTISGDSAGATDGMAWSTS